MQLNGQEEELCFIQIVPKDTKMCLRVQLLISESIEGLCFLFVSVEKENVSEHHFHNQFSPLFDLKRFFRKSSEKGLERFF